MKKLRMLFLIFLFSLCTVYGELTDPNVQAVTEGDPTNNVCDSVNLLTGDFVAFAEDYVIHAIEPLRICRSYISGTGSGDYGGWEFFPHLTLTHLPEKVVKKLGMTFNKHYRQIAVSEPNGTGLIFKKEGRKYLVDFEKHGKGITNISKGVISAKTNIKNHWIELDEDKKAADLYCADGTWRHYKNSEGRNYLLEWELLPNGNKISYKYDKKKRIHRIQTSNEDQTKVYAWCEFEYEKPEKKTPKCDFTIKTSDGKRLHYKFDTVGLIKKPLFYLDIVERPNLPKEFADYTKLSKYWNKLVKSRYLPEGRKINVEYYRPHTSYQVADRDLRIHGSSDPRQYRVRNLWMPLGEDGELIPTHHFVYDISRETDEEGEYTYTNDGKTDVFDVNLEKTTLHFNKEFLPLNLSYYEKGNLHHQIAMEWENYGQLKEKVLLDGEENPVYKKRFSYDKQGNILKQETEGILTEKNHPETVQTCFSYFENRLIEKREPSGKKTQIAYLKNTDLIKSKFTLDNEQILLREFNEYDEDNILIRTIIDDGNTRDIHNLSGVTKRKIQQIYPKKTDPGLNFPDIVEERALNLETGQEVLIEKKRYRYSKDHQITQIDFYDSENHLRYRHFTTYDHCSRPIKKVTPEGTTFYRYDVNNNLIYEKTPAEKEIDRYYDQANRLITEKETSPEGETRITRHEYDAKNNLVKTIDPFENVTKYAYDRFGNLIEIIHPDGSIEQFTYDILGNKTSHTDPLNQTTYTTYNIFGNPLLTRYPDGSEEINTYTLEGKLKTHIDREGNTTKYQYDILGRETKIEYFDESEKKLAEETFIYNSFHLLTHIDKGGVATHYRYDLAGRKTHTLREARQIETEYDPLGRPHREIIHNEKNTLVTSYQYNDKNEIIEECKQDLEGNLLYRERYTYDSLGNKTSICKENSSEFYVYDTFNRLISFENALGEKTLYTYDEAYLNAFNQKVLKKTTIEPSGRKTIEIFDVMMRRVSQEIISSLGEILISEEFSYNLLGNCIHHQYHLFDKGKWIDTYHTLKEYDALQQLTALIEGAYTPEARATYFSYTLSGNLEKVLKPDHTSLEYEYDPFGNVIHLSSSDGTVDYSNEYDLNGNLISSHDNIHHTTTYREYDTSSNLIEETLGNGLTLQNRYDLANRRTELQIETRKIGYFYNPLYLQTVKAFGQKFNYEYNIESQLIQRGEITYVYDALHRKTHLKSPYFNQQIVYKDNNVIESLIDQTLHKYRYDGLDQLIEESGHTYSYDNSHTRLSKDEALYQVNPLHALLQTKEASFTYDSNGNPLFKTPETKYLYDALDRLIEVYDHEKKIQFTYDYFNRRLSKILIKDNKMDTIHFLYDGEDEIGAYSNGQYRELRVLGEKNQAERQALLVILNDYTYKPIQDLYGNIVRLICLATSKVHTYHYTAFGEEETPLDFNPWRYASKRLDPETGLIFFGQRYYDPETGRWLTPDPNPLTDSINLYAYTQNNPLRNVDLYGLVSTEGISEETVSSYYPAPVDYRQFQYLKYEDYCRNIYTVRQNVYSTVLSSFPGGYIDSEELLYPYEKSSVYDLNLPEKGDRRIFFINGVFNSLQDATSSATYLSNLAGGYNIHGIHYATQGHSLDILRAICGSRTYLPTEPGKLLHDCLNDYFAKAPSSATALIIAHSGGAIETRNLLMCYNQELRKRVFVIGIAPGAYIDKETCANVRHYRCEGDPVPYFHIRGAQRNADTIITLHPGPKHQNESKHAIRSNIYIDPLQKNIEHYLEFGFIR